MELWLKDGMLFLCHRCIISDDSINYTKMLTMLSKAVDSTAIHTTASNIQLLLKTYDITLKPPVRLIKLPGLEDNSAINILRKFHPVTLGKHSPRSVVGDGNCLYRAASLAMYGVEDEHLKLRLLTSLEIILHRPQYDSCHPEFSDPIQDYRVIVSPYNEFLKCACKENSYSDLLHMYALSAVIGSPLRSYLPPASPNPFLSEPFTRIVVGRGVRGTASPVITFMWSQTGFKNSKYFAPNHFVPLLRVSESESESTVEIDDSEETEGNINVKYDDLEENSGHDTEVSSLRTDSDLAAKPNLAAQD